MTTEIQENNVNEKSEEISLKELILKFLQWWRYLLSKWLLIVCFGLLGAILGFYYAYSKKRVYVATTTFVLEDEKSGGGLSNLAGLASLAGLDLASSGGGIFQGDNILGLYKSRTMIERTLLAIVYVNGKKESLVEHYVHFNGLRKKWTSNQNLEKLNFFPDSSQAEVGLLKQNRLRDSIISVIVFDINKNYLSVTRPDKKLSTIQVDVKATDEFFAKTFNDELVKNVNEFYVATKTKKNLQNVKILQHKTDSVRSVMNGAIYSSVAISDATPNLNPTRQIQRLAPSQKSQFSAETNKAVLGEMVKNLELTKLALLKETPLIQVIDKPIYPLISEKFGKLKGAVLGGIILGLLTCAALIFRRIISNSLV